MLDVVAVTGIEETVMGLADKAKHAAENVAGKVKETVGKAIGDTKMQNEGKAEQAKSSPKKAGENI